MVKFYPQKKLYRFERGGPDNVRWTQLEEKNSYVDDAQVLVDGGATYGLG